MNLSIKNQVIFLFVSWLLVQCILLYTYGIDATHESLKYIGAANNLLDTGHLPETRYYFYLTTTLIIAFCSKAGLGFVGVVAIQLLLNLFATFSFFKAMQGLQQKKYSAFITTLLLISFLPYQRWNVFLYTESVFYSCSLLFFSSCLAANSMNRKSILVQLLFLFFAIISRPLGILFLPCWVLFIAYRQRIKPVTIAVSFLTSAIVAVVVINTIMRTIGDWQILLPAEYGYIICDIPSRAKINLQHLKQNAPLAQLVLFVVNYPAEFTGLCIKRLNAFFFLRRDYYSMPHNMYLLLYAVLFTIPLAYIIVRRKIMNKQVFYLSAFIVAAFALAIMLQCDDYNNRFHHAIIPVFLFSGVFMMLEKKSVASSVKS